MKKFALTLALVFALLALLSYALSEGTNPGERTVYPAVTSPILPSWVDWSPLLELEGIESYSAVGMIPGAFAGEHALTLYFSTETEEGLDAIGCILLEGEPLSPGKCLIAQGTLAQLGLRVGDTLSLTTPSSPAEFEIGGVFELDENVYDSTDALDGIVLLAEADFLRLLDPDATDCFRISSVTLASAERVASFVEEANALLANSTIQVLTLQEARARASARSNASPTTGGVFASTFDGTDLYGNPLEEELLVPGGVTMVNVWATYCGPCIAEMPDLKALSDEYAISGAPFRIIGICFDVTDASGNVSQRLLENGLAIVENTGADYLHILPGPTLYSEIAQQIRAFPTTFFLNDEGIVLGAYIGSRDEADWRVIIEEMLEAVK